MHRGLGSRPAPPGQSATVAVLAAGRARSCSLLAQGLACLDPVGLFPFGVPDPARRGQHLRRPAGRDEHHAVVVTEGNVVAGDQAWPEPCAGQRGWLPLVQAHRPGGVAAVTEDRKADLGQFGRVTVQPPHHNPRQPGSLRLQRHQVADARLVGPPTVVDYQHVTLPGAAERLQEHIHAAVVARRHRPSGEGAARHDRGDAGRRDAQRHFAADARIGHQRRGKAREIFQHAALPGSVPLPARRYAHRRTPS